MTVISYEILALALIGSSGIVASLLAGVRNPFLIAGSAIGFASTIPLISTLLCYFLGKPYWGLEAWVIISTLVTIIGLSARWQHWQLASQAGAVFAVLSALSLTLKFVFEIGEMQHSDSTGIVSRALLVIQSGATDWSPVTSSPKRGLLYPIMLALGPYERILVTFTPLVFLSTALLVGWMSLRIIGRARPSTPIIALAVTGGFLATIPMIRISATYLNSHILVSYGVTLMATAALLSKKERRFCGQNVWLFGLGGVVATVSRIEAILLVGIIAVSLFGLFELAQRDRRRLITILFVVASSMLIWLWGLNVPVSETFGVPYWMLAGSGVIVLLVLNYVSTTNIRRYFPHLIGVLLGITLILEIFQSASPAAALFSQWPNFALGAGGWAAAMPVTIGLISVLGWRKQSPEYRWLITNAILLSMAILVSKTLDGGLGRAGFYDSVNRMALHVAPLFVMALAIGVGEIFGQSAIFSSSQTTRNARHDK